MKLQTLFPLLLCMGPMFAEKPIHVQSSTEEKTSKTLDFTILYLTPATLFEGEALSTKADVLCIQEIYTDPADIYDLFKSHYAHFLYLPPTPHASGTLLISKYALIENPDCTFTLHNDTTPIANILTGDFSIKPIQPCSLSSTKRSHGPHTETLTLVKHSTKSAAKKVSAQRSSIGKSSQQKRAPKEGVMLCKSSKNKDKDEETKGRVGASVGGDKNVDGRGGHVEVEGRYSRKDADDEGWTLRGRGFMHEDERGKKSVGGVLSFDKDL